jgi:hypothetical protein
MHIRKLYYLHHRFAFLKAWYFLVLAILFAVLAVQGLRDNYSKMVELREAVYVADRENGDVEVALRDLREHVYGHMNTNLSSGNNAIKPPIQLKNQYEKLASVEQDKVKARNSQVAARAEQVCAQQFPGGGYNAPRVTCIQDYVAANAAKADAVPDSLYKFDFVSPRWSPDLAGVSMVLSVLFFTLFIARAALEHYMRRRLD